MKTKTKLTIVAVVLVAFAVFRYSVFFPFSRVEAQRILVADGDLYRTQPSPLPDPARKEVPPESVHIINSPTSPDIPQQVPPEQVQMMDDQSPDVPKEIPAGAFQPATPQ